MQNINIILYFWVKKPHIFVRIYRFRSFSSPIFVFNDSIHNFLHLLCEGGGIGGQFLGRWTSPLPLPLRIIISVPSSSATRGTRGSREVQISVPPSLAGGLFVAHLFLHLLERAFLNRLQTGSAGLDSRCFLFWIGFDLFSPKSP